MPSSPRPTFFALPIVILLALSGLGMAFAILAWGVVSGSQWSFDPDLLLSLRNPSNLTDAIGPLWLEEMMRDFSALGAVGVLILVLVTAVGYLLSCSKLRSAAVLISAVIVAALTSQLMKAGFDRPRPDLVPHGSFVSNASFPSGHTLMATALYLTLGMIIAQGSTQQSVRVFIMMMAALTAVLVGLSRVYLGVHWPTDVLAGWALGAAIALIFTSLLRPSER